MKKRPPDETVGTDVATELYDLLRIAVDATRKVTWRPGDSLESLLAPAVVAIAAEAGKAVRPHADQVRKQIAAELNAHARECHNLAEQYRDERSDLLADEARYFAAAARYISDDEED
ncbi:MAG: hypothetical protein HOY79_17775 [Streptomyces sp.]|nr:hypothetical protein [Streptomyces sp.]